MKWTVSNTRIVAEDDRQTVEVEADSLEEAIERACVKLYHTIRPEQGQMYVASVRVSVRARPRVPLKSI